MKKLYRKGTVHPSPQIKSDDHLFPLLPVAIFSLAAVLSPEDREVLAYLISTVSYSGDRNPTSRLNKTKAHRKSHSHNHSPLFHCNCFSCYTSYWVRWDSSPSRQLIHEIIDAFEDSLEKTEMTKKKKVTGKKDRRKRSGKASLHPSSSFGTDVSESPSQLSESMTSTCSSSSELVDDYGVCNCGSESTDKYCDGDGGEKAEADKEEEKGSIRRFVTFIGEKIFSVWG